MNLLKKLFRHKHYFDSDIKVERLEYLGVVAIYCKCGEPMIFNCNRDRAIYENEGY
jgi:hypothetical protein